MTKKSLEQKAKEMGISVDINDNFIEMMKSRQRTHMQSKRCETEKLRKVLGFSFDGIPRGYRTQSWTPGIRTSR